MDFPFRVWSNKTNKYLDAISLIYSNPGRVVVGHILNGTTFRSENFEPDEIVIERHLKDNKYENDIVRDEDDPEEVFVIKWVESDFRFVLEAPDYALGLDDVNIDKYQVIGNIHKGIEGTLEDGNKIIFQYYGSAKDMPKRMRQYFNSKGVAFEENEWVSVNEYVEYSLENRWGYK